MHKISFFKNKRIGIWGYGLFGKSMLRYLINKEAKITIMDKQMMPPELADKGIHYITQDREASFFNSVDYVIPSQGISLQKHYQTYFDKFIMELDLFDSINKNTLHMYVVAITGTAGKTTITTVLSEILISCEKNIVYGGNIGIPSIDLFETGIKNNATLVILETSSFQLAYTKQFAPDLAIITNISENHLDWHGSMDAYRDAKWHITDFQTSEQQCILPYDVAQDMATHGRLPKSILHIYTPIPQYDHPVLPNYSHSICYVYKDSIWQKKHTLPPKKIVSIASLPDITFTHNWIIIINALIILKISLTNLSHYAKKIQIPAHRLEKIGTYNGITIYNDSKATTIEATQCAIQKLSDRPILLILGGHGKGVDRSSFIATLPPQIKKIYCFGVESEILTQLCQKFDKSVTRYSHLKELVKDCVQEATPNDQILFSPAGSSWDMFTDYQERGNLFKKLVHEQIMNG